MNKNELENIIGKKLGAAGNDQKTAMDVFIQSVSEYINSGDTIRIPDIGMFQLKKIEKSPAADSLRDTSKSLYRLFYVPLTIKKGISDVIVFDVIPDLKKKHGSVDDAFSISIGKPLIPLSETGKDVLLVESSIIMLRGDYREKVQEILENSIHLKDFKLDISLLLIQDDIIQSTLQEAEEKYTKEVDLELSAIPWDFGISSEPENPYEKPKKKIDLKKDDFQSDLTKLNKETDEKKVMKLPDDQQKTNSFEEPEIKNGIITGREEEISDLKNENEPAKIKVENTLELKPEKIVDSEVLLHPNGTNIVSESDLNYKRNNIENINGEEKKSYHWLWFIIFFIIVVVAGLFYYFFIFKNSGNNKIGNQNLQINYSTPSVVQNCNSKKVSFISCGNFQRSNVINFIRLEI